MKIRVKFFAHYRELAGTSQTEIEVQDNLTVAQITKTHIASGFPQLKDYLDSAIVVVNQEYAVGAVKIKHGDELAFLPPISGG